MRTWVLVVVLGLLVSGCVNRSNDDGLTADERRFASLPEQQAGTVDEVSLLAPGSTAPPSGLSARTFDGEADLRGPHFTVRIDWVATGPAIEEYAIPLAADLSPRRAADGQEIVVVAVSGEFTNGQWTLGDRAKPVAELLIDGKATALTSVPLPPTNDPVPMPAEGALLVVSVGKRDPLELRVTDEEKTQTVDLRAGKRKDDEIPGYYQPVTQELDYDTEIPLGFSSGRSYSTTLSITDSPLSEFKPPLALLAPWSPANGWAPAGRAWFVVPHPVLYTPISIDTPGLVLAIDEAAVFKLRMADGSEIPETGGTRQVTTLGGEFDARGDDLIFDVPASFTAGTFVMRLSAATATAEFSNGQLPAGWRPDPQPFELAIDLTK